MRKFKYPLIIGILLISAVTYALTSQESNTEIETTTASASDDAGGVIHLNAQSFKQYVFDYEKNQTWKYEGKVPAILDFYADWCGPCKMLSPVLQELQKEYDGKIQVYKINTDKERELASTFGIRSLPTIVFVPLEGDPQAAMGFRPKADMETMIKEILKVEK
nr:thioredoxin [uncultured Carboxylicivirga sp.]